MRAVEVLGLIEAAYQVEVSPADWLRGVLAAARPHLDCGAGVAAYFVDVSTPAGFVASGYVGEGLMGSTDGVARFEAWDRMTPAVVKRHIHLFGAGGTSGTIPFPATEPDLVARLLDTHRYPDILGVNAIDASGRGCSLAAAIPGPGARPFPFGHRDLLDRIAAHLAAGARINRTLGGRGEAVISAGGKVEHAEGAATSAGARDALRTAVIAIDRMRARPQRLSADDATDIWQALIGGRWSVVDSFERDGRRFYVAHPNQPRPQPRGALTEREAQVVGAVAMGHSNKAIAYELGLSLSTVATHIRRARTKLAVSSRIELIQAHRALTRRG